MATPITELIEYVDKELKLEGYEHKTILIKLRSLMQKEREMMESAYKDAMLTGYSCSEINERYEDIIFNGQKAAKLMDTYIDNLFKTEV
jgi:hypothetical protein